MIYTQGIKIPRLLAQPGLLIGGSLRSEKVLFGSVLDYIGITSFLFGP